MPDRGKIIRTAGRQSANGALIVLAVLVGTKKAADSVCDPSLSRASSPAGITIPVCGTNNNAPVAGTIIAGVSAAVVGGSVAVVVIRWGVPTVISRGIAAIAVARSTIVTGAICVGAGCYATDHRASN